MHKGKLLSLDLLLRVLSNPMHDWSHVRPVFAAELRQPLCVALLRNCMSPYDQVGAGGENRSMLGPTMCVVMGVGTAVVCNCMSLTRWVQKEEA